MQNSPEIYGDLASLQHFRDTLHMTNVIGENGGTEPVFGGLSLFNDLGFSMKLRN